MGFGVEMSLIRRCSWLFCAAALGSSVGCARSAPATTVVASGAHYQAGEPEYDGFFDTVHQLQLTLARAPEDRQRAELQLREAAVLKSEATASVLAEQLRSELERIGNKAGRLRVELVAPDSPELDKTHALISANTKPNTPEAKFLATVEGSVTELMRLNVAMKRAREELGTLCSTAARLEGRLDATFPGTDKHAEVQANLRDAERVIALMIARADETAKPTDEFLGKFAVALGTGFQSPAPKAPTTGSERVAKAAPPVTAPAPDSRSREPARPAAPQKPPSEALEPVTRADFDP